MGMLHHVSTNHDRVFEGCGRWKSGLQGPTPSLARSATLFLIHIHLLHIIQKESLIANNTGDIRNFKLKRDSLERYGVAYIIIRSKAWRSRSQEGEGQRQLWDSRWQELIGCLSWDESAVANFLTLHHLLKVQSPGRESNWPCSENMPTPWQEERVK